LTMDNKLFIRYCTPILNNAEYGYVRPPKIS